ncbi:Mitochondrial metalloendopeptidase OMA1 [Choanephora cucurbitarum]|uniref:Mitochondrial metalloendopeptidase OMA1 n=1 Tax=Choanephora cucurbitarum TaxID=101091 RepID=A0A1C7NIF7_9FUNG|nr:Mitochondrial metalloendopeptidase OMA1 [Choanephora cucurbitarum]
MLTRILQPVKSTLLTGIRLPKQRYASYSRFPLQPIKNQPPSNYTRFQNNQRIPFYLSKRVWVFVGTGTVMFGGYYVTHLERVPISNRVRFMDVTPRQEEAMAIQAYHEVMAQFGRRILPANHPYSRFVRKVAQRLVRVSGMDHMKWEFYVIDSPERNAFVLPGGKVFVFTGILPVVQNEDGMAAVLGHEISHQLARHSAEKFSFVKILFALQFTLTLFGIDPSFIFNQFSLSFLMMKPFSRKCETEADDIGLQLMALACFNPQEAIEVWKRMDAMGEHEIPQFASTHPSHKNRIEFLRKEVGLGMHHLLSFLIHSLPNIKLPAAMKKRAESDCSSQMKTFADQFADTWARW